MPIYPEIFVEPLRFRHITVTRLNDSLAMEISGFTSSKRLEELLPLNLKGVVGQRTLMRMTFEAVGATNWPAPLPPIDDRPPEPVLRTLTAFCYCTGLFSSREIESAARFDASIPYLCANDFPTWQELRQFRRRNNGLLRETLARLFQMVCDEIGTPVAFFSCVAEAERRLKLAVEADSAAMDD